MTLPETTNHLSGPDGCHEDCPACKDEAVDYRYSIGRDGVSITFPAKPSEQIRTMLKANGFRWSPRGGCWWRRRIDKAGDFLAALDRVLNPGPDGKCWVCKDPKGYFRPYGAATPVYCDACHAKSQDAIANGFMLHTAQAVCQCCVCAEPVDIGDKVLEAAGLIYCCRECFDAAQAQRGRDTKTRCHDDPMGVDTLYEDQCRDACGL